MSNQFPQILFMLKDLTIKVYVIPDNKMKIYL